MQHNYREKSIQHLESTSISGLNKPTIRPVDEALSSVRQKLESLQECNAKLAARLESVRNVKSNQASDITECKPKPDCCSLVIELREIIDRINFMNDFIQRITAEIEL